MAYIDELTISLITLPIFWGAMFPDFDHQIKSHRNILFHSIGLNLFVWFFNQSMFTALLTMSVGIHLLFDCKWWTYKDKKFIKKGGSFCIDLYYYRLSTMWTVIWLIVNFVGSVGLFVLELLR